MEHALTSMRLVWRYRFLLRDRAELADGTSRRVVPVELAADLDRLRGLVERLVTDGHFRRSVDVDVAVLSRSLWIVSRYWLDHLDEFGQLDEAARAPLVRGIAHHRAVLDPYLTADARRRLDDAFRRAAPQPLAS
ncbi:MAG: TetR/AcrR family transcriptional regulator [Ilumatobacteraceae bacterium]